jgi:hypothetical protein
MKPLIWQWTHEIEYRSWAARVRADEGAWRFEVPLCLGQPHLPVTASRKLRGFSKIFPSGSATRTRWLESLRKGIGEASRRWDGLDRDEGILVDYLNVEIITGTYKASSGVALVWTSGGVVLGLPEEVIDSDAMADLLLLRLQMAEREGPRCE